MNQGKQEPLTEGGFIRDPNEPSVETPNLVLKDLTRGIFRRDPNKQSVELDEYAAFYKALVEIKEARAIQHKTQEEMDLLTEQTRKALTALQEA